MRLQAPSPRSGGARRAAAVRTLALLLSVLALRATGASAQPSRTEELPAALCRRPLTLPAGVLRIDNGLYGRGSGPNDRVIGFLLLGAGLGLTRDLEIGFLEPFPQDPSFYARLRIASGQYVELAAESGVRAPMWSRSEVDLWASMPLRLRPLPWLRVDATIRLDTYLSGPRPAQASLPLALVVSPFPFLSFGVQGSVGNDQSSGWAGDLGGFLALTAANRDGAARADFRGTFQALWAGQGQPLYALALNFQFYPPPLWR